MGALKGGKSLKLEDVKVGQHVFVKQENADIFSIPMRFTDANYTYPHGIYEVTAVEHRTPDPQGSPPVVVPACNVMLHWPGWNPKLEGLFIVLNKFSQAVVAGNQVVVNDPMYPVAHTTKDLDVWNTGRIHCIMCNRKLNVCSVNLRICNHCEKILAKPEEEKENDDTGLDFLPV